MTAIDTTRALPHAGTGLFARIAGAFQTWNDARVTRKALSALSDRELDDIGLCRGDIERIAARD